jgi:IS5 family transposase
VKWRRRVGVEGTEKLLAGTVATAQRMKLLKRSDLAKVNVDTTVQEKAIAFPTDARLYHKMRVRLVNEAKRRGLGLRQSYRFVGKRALARQGRYAHARQMKRAKRETRKLKTYLGRITRALRRTVPAPDPALATLLERAEKLLAQTRTSSHKLYAVHAPEGECIANGKAHKRYEFGCKVSIAITSKHNWGVGLQALQGNPYDGHTLSNALRQVETLTGWQPEDAYCDQGYRGHGYTGDTRVHIVGRYPKKATRAVKRWLRRRAAIEPVIGHVKSDHRMDRNPLKGTEGDQMHALLCGCGFNLAKLLVAVVLRLFSRCFLAVLWPLLAGQHPSRALSPTLCVPCPRCAIGTTG